MASKSAQVKELYLQGKSNKEIAEELGMQYNSVSSIVSRTKRSLGQTKTESAPVLKTNSDKMTYRNGETTYEVCAEGEAPSTPEEAMRAKGLDPKQWEVVTYTVNSWQQQAKEDCKVTLYQYKLIVKPAKKVGLTIEDIDNYYNEMIGDLSKGFEVNPIEYDKTAEVLEIDVADLHCGLLSWAFETGSDDDCQKTADRFLAGIYDIAERCQNKQLSKIYFCTLGDILNADTFAGTTTKGTQQDMDLRIHNAIDVAFHTMQAAIVILSQLGVPMEYIYTCGNHDNVTGYCVAKMLEVANKDNEIIFNITPNPQKAIHFGNVLVGLTHGEMPKYNKGTWLINDYRREFGESYFVEEHCGHVHHEEAKEYNGIMVRSVLAQCGNSYWEHKMGYRSNRGIMCFVWNPETGLRETMYYNY